MSQDKLQWKVKHKTDFAKEYDFLESVLIENGVEAEDIPLFLNPKKKECINDPFLMKNMDKAVEVLHEFIADDKKRTKKSKKVIRMRVDPDVDGYTSSAYLTQFIQEIYPEVIIEHMFDFNKRHGLNFDDVSDISKTKLGLIIVPDSSITCKDARQITTNFYTPILVIDHHLIENEFFNKEDNTWISKDEAKELYKKDKEKFNSQIEVDTYTNYCVAVNCTDGEYPNPTLSGVGVVHKFCEAYCEKYNLDDEMLSKYLDLVSLGIVADSMSLKNLETRYYVIEGLKERNYHNEFINELAIANADDLKFGRTIVNSGWTLAPKINGCIRYGKDKEEIDLFRAMCGVQEDVEYQPRRASKYDPKPPIEIHSLQKTMARVVGNVKSRQDNEVRKFMKLIEEKIATDNLLNNSILFIDGTDILTKATVTGLVANKLASKYFRPVVILKSKNSQEFGGSGRGYDKGNIDNFNEFLSGCGVTCMGHPSAFGVNLNKEDLPTIIKNCNQKLPLDKLCTIHTVDWEIKANKLKREYVQEVAENYAVFGNDVPEPLFAISDLHINASKINGYGENCGFIRFVYNGITFTKKYCPIGDYDKMTMKGRNTLGVNKKNLVLNIIGQFVLNAWEDRVNPEVKILYYDVREDTDIDIEKDCDSLLTDEEDSGIIQKKKSTENKTNKRKIIDELDDDDFVF